MKAGTKGKLLKGTAVAVDVAVPLTVALTQFPIWIEKSSEATVSGLFLLFAFLSSIPLLKHIKAFFKSPSIPVLWCVAFVLLMALRNIIDEMLAVCLAGVISNAVGAGIYRLGRYFEERQEE